MKCSPQQAQSLKIKSWLCLIRFDPDILVGYEVQMHSWGYLLQRAAVLGVDLCQQLSRIPGRAVFHYGWVDCEDREVEVDLFVSKRQKSRNIFVSSIQ